MTAPAPRAVLLDMDGVIVDSELQWKLLEAPFFTRILGRWDEADHRHIVGLGVKELHGWLVDHHGLKQTQPEFLKECEGLARQVYAEKVTLTPGLSGFMERVSGKRTLGLASSSPRAWIDLVLGRFKLGPYFQAVLSGDDVPGRTKPEPDIYLEAARRLALEPKDCLAVEDSKLGVAAAKAAGMRCAAFRNGHNHEQDLSKADFEFHSFAELEV
jgi:HAD superfamily hydrolase (TIGR01509 family)